MSWLTTWASTIVAFTNSAGIDPAITDRGPSLNLRCPGGIHTSGHRKSEKPRRCGGQKSLIPLASDAEGLVMTRQGHEPPRDPYRRCERGCQHDLGRGVSLAELLGTDGPHEDPRQLLEPRNPTPVARLLVRTRP